MIQIFDPSGKTISQVKRYINSLKYKYGIDTDDVGKKLYEGKVT